MKDYFKSILYIPLFDGTYLDISQIKEIFNLDDEDIKKLSEIAISVNPYDENSVSFNDLFSKGEKPTKNQLIHKLLLYNEYIESTHDKKKLDFSAILDHVLDSANYLKYLKYKNKYLKLKNSI